MTDNFPDSVNTGKYKLHKTTLEQQSRDMRRLDVSRKYIFKAFFNVFKTSKKCLKDIFASYIPISNLVLAW